MQPRFRQSFVGRKCDGLNRRSVTAFCSFLPFTFVAGAVLPVSAILPLSLVWTFSGRRWFALASLAFVCSRISDLQLVYLFLAGTLGSLGISPALIQPVAVSTMVVVLSSFLVDAWLIKRWASARISKYAPGLISLGRIAR